jgi:hypothetical protein
MDPSSLKLKQHSFRRTKRLSLVFAVLAVLVPLASSQASQGRESLRLSSHAPFGGFPLWKDVPGSTFAVLGKGELHRAAWAVFASRGSRTQSRERPCITVARITRDQRYANAGSCGPLAPIQGPHTPPLHPLIGEGGASIFGLSFGREVVRVEVETEPGGILDRRPSLLSRRQAEKSHLPRFRYLAAALPYDVCIEGIRGFDEAGRKILDASTGECPLAVRP